MKKKTKAKRKSSKPQPQSIFAVRLTQSEKAALQLRANWFALRNLAAWLRYAGLRYKPAKGENVSKLIVSKKR